METCYHPAMGTALVLNASDAPLAVIPARRAVVLIMKAKADMVVPNGDKFRSETILMDAPSVIRLRYYVNVPYRQGIPLTRRSIFQRDGWVCQYCGKEAQNIDHVIPRSQGGQHLWENVVAACIPCNSKKAHRTPDEAGMVLRTKPFMPRGTAWIAQAKPRPEWEPYLTA